MRDDIDNEDFQKRLKERRQKILAEKAANKKGNDPVELDQARVGRLSRMDAMQQQAMSQAAARLLDAELLRIKAALNRMAEKEYGYCIICEEEIAEKRLQFDPSLLTCISCAQRAEQ